MKIVQLHIDSQDLAVVFFACIPTKGSNATPIEQERPARSNTRTSAI
jgi:hypothetical protein